MNHGFVPIATISPQSRVADPFANAELCYQELQKASQAGAKIVVFPEVVLTSYIADDMLYHSLLLDSAQQALADLLKRTKDLDIVFSIGIPLCINGKIYNTVAVCHTGSIMGVVPKTFIPTYGVDFEGRWFHPGPAEVTSIDICGQTNIPFGSHQVFRCRTMPELCLGYEICEDIWAPNPPSIGLALAGATVICNGSASNASLEKDLYRRGLISGQSARLLCCYAYCSSGQGDSTGDVTVGGQEIIAENGNILAQSLAFGEGFAIADVDVESLWGARRGMSSFHVAPTPQSAGYHETLFDMNIPEHPLIRPVSKRPFIPNNERDLKDCCQLTLKIQVHGLLARISNQNASHVAIDSTNASVQNVALAMIAGAQLFNSEDAHGPDVYLCLPSTAHTTHAQDLLTTLAEALHMPVATLTTPAIQHETANATNPLHPTLDLQDLITDSSWMLINTSDMTQLALGLAQFPFDLGRQYGINSQLVHTFVPEILRTFTASSEDHNLQAALQAIMQENDDLHAPQHDTESEEIGSDLGPADVQDFFLDGFLRAQYRPAKSFVLAQQAFSGTYTDKQLLTWMKVFYERFFASQYLRHSLPDGPRIGSAGLDMRDGFMMPAHMEGSLWINEVQQLIDQLK